MSNISSRTLAAAALGASVLASLAACGGSTHTAAPAAARSPSASSSPASSSPASSPASAPPSCESQFTSWRDGGGAADLKAVGTDTGTLSAAVTALANDMGSGADPSADEGSVQQAAASLQSDTQAAEADLPPSCVPGLRQHLSAAFTDLDRSAIEAGQAVSELTSGNDAVAASDVEAANAAMTAGVGELRKALADVNAFNGS